MIRKLEWNDMNCLIDNYYSFYDEMRAENPDMGLVFYDEKPDLPSEMRWFTNLFQDILRKDAIALVAEEAGKVVGVCDIHREMPNSDISHKGVLGMAIIKEYRGKGIGRDLIGTIIGMAREIFDTIVLSVFASNTRAVSLYRSLGFVEYGRMPFAVKRNGKYYEEIMMYRKL